MTPLEFALLIGGPLALITAVSLGLFALRVRSIALRVGTCVVASLGVAAAIFGLGARYRGPPTPTQRTLSSGIEYSRYVLGGPVVVHVARVDLARPDLEVVTTAPARGDRVPAQRVSEFAAEHHAAIAINTAFFRPFYSNHPLDFYPRSGDPTEPFGVLMSDGVEFGHNRFHDATIYFDEDRASLTAFEGARWATSGYRVLVRDGEVAELGKSKGAAPRSVIGFDGERLLLVVVDGRQPGYSEGLTIPDLAALLVELGARWAVEMDGGGSSTLVDGSGRTPRVLNCPIHTRVPCRERPVAAQLGVRRTE